MNLPGLRHFRIYATAVLALLVIAISARSAYSQNTFPTPSGSVGVSTSSPQAQLHVNSTSGAIENLDSSSGNGGFSAFYDAVSTRTARGFVGFGPTLFGTGDNSLFGLRSQGALTFATNGGYRQMTIDTNGRVGIGTTSPAGLFHVSSPYANTSSFRIDNVAAAGGRTYEFNPFLSGVSNGGFELRDVTAGASRIAISSSGNVGIGKPNPAVALDVVGSINLTGTISAKYQDVAEWVPSSEQLAPGTVVVLDSTKSNQVIASSVSYDTRVASVISERPGLALGEKGEGKVLVASTGRVKIKVDAGNSPIRIGDLLVTSDIPGVAMKSEAVNLGGVQFHRPGTLIGKALEPLGKGKGEILVLLSLQ